MSLDLKVIEEIVMNEDNAGEFAELIREFKKIGIKKYDYMVEAGIYRYYDEEAYLEIQMNGIPQEIATVESSIKIKKAVIKAQSGKITFEDFTELAGAAGVIYWQTNLDSMQVIYFGKSGNILLNEPIPEG